MRNRRNPYPWAATLTRSVTVQVPFDGVDVPTGNTLSAYAVEHTMQPGPRRFRTKGNRDRWVALMNQDHGAGTARDADCQQEALRRAD